MNVDNMAQAAVWVGYLPRVTIQVTGTTLILIYYDCNATNETVRWLGMVKAP